MTIKKKVTNLVFHLSTQFILGKNLRDSILSLLNELPNNVRKETLANVLSHLLWRLTRIGLFAIAIVLIPYILFFQQNRLIKHQNIRIDQQTELLEANRRSSYIFLMSNVLDKIDEELSRDYLNDSIRNLSPQLIGRIAALSFAFKPYKYLENNKLTKDYFSPERGQLLLSLIKSDLDTSTYLNIYRNSTFQYAELKNSNLIEAYLRDIDISNSNLAGTKINQSLIFRVDFNNSILDSVTFDGSTIYASHFDDCSLFRSSFRGAEIIATNFKEANLEDSDFRNNYLHFIKGGHFNYRISSGVMSGPNGGFFTKNREKFSRFFLDHVNFESAKLDGIKVSLEDWVQRIEVNRELRNEVIKEKYYVDLNNPEWQYNKPDSIELLSNLIFQKVDYYKYFRIKEK